jgi:L-glyceraldehyde 3-phosphate reductase
MTSVYRPSSDRYEAMTYARTGRSGLMLPKVSLGLWQNFGDDRAFAVQRAILLRAFDSGVTHFDLANNYGPPYGSAEQNFGRHFAADLRPYRDEIVVSTKAGFDMWAGPYGDHGSRKHLLASLDASLARTGLDYFDIFYHHRPDPDTPIEETMGALASAVAQGKALYVGVSNYDAEETRRATEVLARQGVRLMLVQPQYSMFTRGPESGLLATVGDLGIGAIVYSPLEQGLLTDRYLSGRIPADSRVAIGRDLEGSAIGETYRGRALALQSIAAERGQTLAQLALRWVLRDEVVTSAVIGASSVGQLEQNLAALDSAPLTPEELRRIDEHAIDGTSLTS